MNIIGRSKRSFGQLFSMGKKSFNTLNYIHFPKRYFSCHPREYRTHNSIRDIEFNKNLTHSSCDKCSHECEDQYKFFCDGCKYLKNPDFLDDVDHFELFDLQETYDVDIEKLEQTFYQLQHMFHPDRFAVTGDEDLMENSTTYSSFINNSYKLLKDDLERAKYLLERKGYTVLEEGEQIKDFEFLQHIMEIREEIEFSETLEELNILKSDALLKKRTIVEEVSEYFRLEEYEEIKDLIVNLRYTTRILEAIDAKERQFI